MNKHYSCSSLGLTGALLRRVLMPCLLFISSSALTGLNMNEAFADLGAGGRHPCLFSYVRQAVHSKRLSLPAWCQSLEPITRLQGANGFRYEFPKPFGAPSHAESGSKLKLTCCTAVAAALYFLFTVLTVKVILTGRTCIHCGGKKRSAYTSGPL